MTDLPVKHPSEAENNARQPIELIIEILDGRAAGFFDTNTGNADDDLLAAAEEADEAILSIIRDLRMKALAPHSKSPTTEERR